jgi:hypothetical protein
MIIHYDKYPTNLKHILIKSKKGACPLFLTFFLNRIGFNFEKMYYL